jgi:hypothetical protein
MKTDSKNAAFTLFMLACWALPACTLAQQSSGQNEPLHVPHVIDFEVTGDGRTGHWEKAPWIMLTKRRGSADYRTTAKVLYSDTGIYTWIVCADNKITATLTEDNADLYTEDVVEVFFWTDESTPLYFEYELSPLNYELAILVPNFKGDFFGWTPWHYEGVRKTRHATKIIKDEKGLTSSWSAEFFIPYALLKPLVNVPPKKGTQWRMNIYRIDYDEGYTGWTWKPVQTNYHDFERFGIIQFE